jgi:hypothetical protein
MVIEEKTPGTILVEKAYALGKMAESSSWYGLLRTGITPCDIDLCFDNNGKMIFGELSSHTDTWNDISYGQRKVYEGAIAHQPHCAVLCKHSIKPEMDRAIDTRFDVEKFQVMLWDFEFVLSPTYDGKYWETFVKWWVNFPLGPLELRRRILGGSVGLIKPAAEDSL